MKHTILQPIRQAPIPTSHDKGIPAYKRRNLGLYDEPGKIPRVKNECRNTREDALRRVEERYREIKNKK